MDPIVTTTASILAITSVVWVLKRLSNASLCPICVGVGSTWLWMVVARLLGYPIDVTMLAILLGGSVVGIANMVEKRLPPAHSALLWKTLFIPAGFAATYALATQRWTFLTAAAVVMVSLAIVFLRPPDSTPQTNEKVDELTRKMKNCC